MSLGDVDGIVIFVRASVLCWIIGGGECLLEEGKLVGRSVAIHLLVSADIAESRSGLFRTLVFEGNLKFFTKKLRSTDFDY